MDVRKKVAEFAEAMEDVLKENDYKGGWNKCSRAYLDDKMLEEVCEYLLSRTTGGMSTYTKFELIHKFITTLESVQRSKDINKEPVDIANIALMIWDNWRKKNGCKTD